MGIMAWGFYSDLVFANPAHTTLMSSHLPRRFPSPHMFGRGILMVVGSVLKP